MAILLQNIVQNYRDVTAFPYDRTVYELLYIARTRGLSTWFKKRKSTSSSTSMADLISKKRNLHRPPEANEYRRRPVTSTSGSTPETRTTH